MSTLTDRDIQNALSDWNTEGFLPGCGEAHQAGCPCAPACDSRPGHLVGCECPPYLCRDCGTKQPQTEPCGCWIKIEDVPLADIKAIFAQDSEYYEDQPGLSLGVPR